MISEIQIPLRRKVSEVKTSLRKVDNILSKYSEDDVIDNMDGEDNDEILHRLEIASLCFRYAEGKTWENKNPFVTREDSERVRAVSSIRNAPYNNYVKVEFENGILKVTTPLTFKRYVSNKNICRNYDLSNYVKSEFYYFLKNNPHILDDFIQKRPYVVICTRYHNEPDSRTLCDNDNAENSRTINEIFFYLKTPDNGSMMDYCSRVRKCNTAEECRVEFVVLPRSDLKNHLDELI